MKNIPDTVQKTEIQKKIIAGIKDLPPYPQVIFKAKQLIKDKKSGLGEISEIILKDPALAARVLRLANSAYYNIKGKVGSIKYAAQILGIETLCEIIETASADRLFDNQLEPYALSPEKIWRHSLFVAFAAKTISARFNQGFEADSFTSGLLHDCGKILLSPFLNDYKEIYNDIRLNSTGMAAEAKITGISHAQAGYAMVRTWNLPVHIQNAIRDHHKTVFTNKDKFSAILSIANLMALDSIDKGSMISVSFESMNDFLDLIAIDINQIIEISSKAYEFTEEICS